MGQIADLWAKLSLRPDAGSFEKGHELLEKVKTAFEIFLGVEAIHKVTEWVEHTAELAGHATEAAQKIGTTVEAVQELGYAASLTEVSQEGLESALGKLAVKLDEVATKGSGPAADAFKRLGLSADQIKGKSIDTDLGLIADKFAAMPDGASKAALAVELFGKAGREMIPLLNKGSAGIAEMRQESEDLGLVIGGETAESFKEFEKDEIRVKGALQGLKNQAIIALLPTIREMVEGLREWIKQNKEIIASTIKGVVEALIIVFRALAVVIKTFVVPILQFFVEHSELAQNALLALGIALVIFERAAIRAALASTAAWIAAAAPFILVVAAITAIIVAIRLLVKNWDTVKRAVSSAISTIWSKIRDVGSGIYSFFAGIGSAIVDAIQAAIDFVVEKIDWVVNKVQSAKDAVSDFFDTSERADTPTAQQALYGLPPENPTPTRTPDNVGGTNVQVQMGDINVTAPTGTDPAQFAEAARPAMRQMLDDEYRRAHQ